MTEIHCSINKHNIIEYAKTYYINNNTKIMLFTII